MMGHAGKSLPRPLHVSLSQIQTLAHPIRRRVPGRLSLEANLDRTCVRLEAFGTREARRYRADFGEATW